jgi:hypothetical protein
MNLLKGQNTHEADKGADESKSQFCLQEQFGMLSDHKSLAHKHFGTICCWMVGA